MAPWHWPYRTVYIVGALVCILLLGYAWYAEPLSGLGTCAACLVEVIAFLWMTLGYLAGGLHAPQGGWRWTYMALVLLGAVAGVAAAVQNLFAPATPALQSLACRSGNCAQAAWRFLGLTMSAWATIWYVLLAAFAIHGALHPYSPRQLARRRAAQAAASED